MPSKKLLEKAAKQAAARRTVEERTKEVVTLRTKLQMFGFPDDCEGMVEMERLFAEFIEHGETVTAKVSFREWDRVAEILLPARRTAETSIVLRYVGEKKASTSKGGIVTTNISKAAMETDAALAARAAELLGVASRNTGAIAHLEAEHGAAPN